MAIRKVSDLEYLDVLSVYNSPLSNCLDEMLIETSYPKQLGDKSFVSMKMLFGDMADAINASIVCSNTTVDFYSPVAFHNHLSALDDFWLSGNFYVNNVVNGYSLRAKMADLAEIYDADEDYEPGTLVKFGGPREITIADDFANAVITTNPGLVLGTQNEVMKFAKGITLVGRVPVKCIGEVKKFDKLVLSKTPGFAETANHASSQIVGIALEDSNDQMSCLVETVVKLSL